jgi:hypothetical protein
VTLVWPEKEMHRFGYPVGPWRRVARHVDLHVVPGEHTTSVTKYVASVAKCVRACLETGLKGGRPVILIGWFFPVAGVWLVCRSKIRSVAHLGLGTRLAFFLASLQWGEG